MMRFLHQRILRAQRVWAVTNRVATVVHGGSARSARVDSGMTLFYIPASSRRASVRQGQGTFTLVD